MRWSLSRLFRSVSANDFREAVNTVAQSMQENCGPIQVEIKCYNDLKHSITMWDPESQDWWDEQNAKKVFQEFSGTDQLTDELWLQTKFIEATFRPLDEDKAPAYAFGVVEAKGLRRKQIGFYVQPDQAGGPAQAATEEKFKRWIRGDGFAANHSVSLR